jgi:ceramide glucosyltransferase
VTALSCLTVAWAFAAFVFSVAAWSALGRLLRRGRAQVASPTRWPKIAILRPCEGVDADLVENLASAALARYDGAREVFLLVPSRTDPAYAAAQAALVRARAQAPSVPVRLVVTSIESTANRKVAQLAHVVTDADVLVVADSDLRLEDATLPSLMAVLQANPRAGAATAACCELADATLGDRLAALLLTSTPHAFLCLAALAERSGGAHVLSGALIAVRRAVLDEVGGFVSLEPFLGEDFELARRLHARGYAIATSPVPTLATDRGRSLGFVVRRFARWSTVTRRQRAHLFPTYLLLLGCTPLLTGLALILALARAPLASVALIAVGVALFARGALASRLRASYGLPSAPLRSLLAAFAGEALIVVSALGALGRPIIDWRGRRYRVERGGLLTRI